MKETLLRLMKCTTYSELRTLKAVLVHIDYKSGVFVASKVADNAKITRSVVVNALCKAEIAGLIETRSLGMKGTYIKILEEEALRTLVEGLN